MISPPHLSTPTNEHVYTSNGITLSGEMELTGTISYSLIGIAVTELVLVPDGTTRQSTALASSLRGTRSATGARTTRLSGDSGSRTNSAVLGSDRSRCTRDVRHLAVNITEGESRVDGVGACVRVLMRSCGAGSNRSCPVTPREHHARKRGVLRCVRHRGTNAAGDRQIALDRQTSAARADRRLGAGARHLARRRDDDVTLRATHGCLGLQIQPCTPLSLELNGLLVLKRDARRAIDRGLRLRLRLDTDGYPHRERAVARRGGRGRTAERDTRCLRLHRRRALELVGDTVVQLAHVHDGPLELWLGLLALTGRNRQVEARRTRLATRGLDMRELHAANHDRLLEPAELRAARFLVALDGATIQTNRVGPRAVLPEAVELVRALLLLDLRLRDSHIRAIVLVLTLHLQYACHRHGGRRRVHGRRTDRDLRGIRGRSGERKDDPEHREGDRDLRELLDHDITSVMFGIWQQRVIRSDATS